MSAPSLCRQTLATFPLRGDAASSVSGIVIPATVYDLSDGNIVFEYMTKEPTASAPFAMKIKRVAPTGNNILTDGAKRFRVWRRFGGKGGLAVSPETVGLSEFVHVVVRIARSDIETLAHLTYFRVVDEHSKSTSCSLVIVN